MVTVSCMENKTSSLQHYFGKGINLPVLELGDNDCLLLTYVPNLPLSTRRATTPSFGNEWYLSIVNCFLDIHLYTGWSISF